jgi:hypothetical protein
MSEPVNERSTPTVEVSFFDEHGTAITPTAGTYRIDDEDSGVEILAATILPDLDEMVELELTAEQTRILDSTHSVETRIITIAWDYGTSKHGTAEYRMHIRNLVSVPNPEPEP